jgi:RNA polymerase sigma-70 factor (ECF subfamily)
MAEDSTSDAQLLYAFAQGDAKAVDVLVSRYRQALFSWFVGMTGNHADAEDLFQELWFRVIRHADRFNDVSFKAWLWKIARNLLIDFRRKKKPDVSLDAVDDEDSQPLVDQLASPERGPADRVERDDLSGRVLQAVGRLPPIQRELFLMRVQGGLSFSEIATTLDIPLNTALWRMHDAMTKLKKMLAEESCHEKRTHD